MKSGRTNKSNGVLRNNSEDSCTIIFGGRVYSIRMLPVLRVIIRRSKCLGRLDNIHITPIKGKFKFRKGKFK